MKKTLSLILAVLMAASILTGCGQEQTPTTVPSTDGSTVATTPGTAEPTSEPTTEPTTEPMTEPTTEPTEPPHEHSYTSVVTAPTCESKGYTTYTCSCGDSYTGDETKATGHNYTGKTTNPTCENKGYTKYTCSVCGDSYKSDYKDATGHNYKTETVAPTTEAEGYDLHTCSVCGKSYKDNYTDKLPAPTEHEHEWVYTEYVGPEACREGYMVYTCACGETKTEGTGDRLDCAWEAIEVVPPTTEEMGYTVYKCSYCGNTWTDYDKEKLPAETEPTSTEPADGSETGYYWGKESGYIGAPTVKIYHDCATQGHVHGESVVVQEMTCVQYYAVQYTCKVIGCGAVWTEYGTALNEHTASDEIIAQCVRTDEVTGYWTRCTCTESSFYGETQEEALQKFEDHYATHGDDAYKYELWWIHKGYKVIKPDYFTCTVCNQTLEYSGEGLDPFFGTETLYYCVDQ